MDPTHRCTRRKFLSTLAGGGSGGARHLAGPRGVVHGFRTAELRLHSGGRFGLGGPGLLPKRHPEDYGERIDLSAAEPQQAGRLSARLDALLAEMKSDSRKHSSKRKRSPRRKR